MKKYIYPDNGKYIQKTEYGTYRIVKTHYKNGKQFFKYYGRFKDYNKAIQYRDKCIAANWNIPPYVNPLKYILEVKNKNSVSYKVRKSGEHYGTFSNLTDAIAERDLLLQYDWDLEKVCELADDRINELSFMRGLKV